MLTNRPSGAIEREAGLAAGAFSHYRKLLEDMGRIVTVKARPFTAKVNARHPDNLRCLQSEAVSELPAPWSRPAEPPMEEAARPEAEALPELVLEVPVPRPNTDWLVAELEKHGWHVTLSR